MQHTAWIFVRLQAVVDVFSRFHSFLFCNRTAFAQWHVHEPSVCDADAVRYRSLWGLSDRTGAGKHGSAIKRPDPVLMKAQIQMPFYTDCFRKPDIVAGAIEASQTCLPLLQNNDPTPEFRSQESVVLDASRCQFYLNQTEAARSVQHFLEPKRIRMRANSTDHDVFLQVAFSRQWS